MNTESPARLRERRVAESKRKRSENLSAFFESGGIAPPGSVANLRPNQTYIEAQEKPLKPSTLQGSSIKGSFDRMMDMGRPEVFGERMKELEKASMRLGDAASRRRIAEMEKEQQLKASGIESQAKAARKIEIELELNRLKSSTPSGKNQFWDWRDRINALEREKRAY